MTKAELSNLIDQKYKAALSDFNESIPDKIKKYSRDGRVDIDGAISFCILGSCEIASKALYSILSDCLPLDE